MRFLYLLYQHAVPLSMAKFMLQKLTMKKIEKWDHSALKGNHALIEIVNTVHEEPVYQRIVLVGRSRI